MPPGINSITDLTTRDWVRTNNWLGYGCACLDVVIDPAARVKAGGLFSPVSLTAAAGAPNPA